MKSKEIAKALRLIAEGFTTLANAYEVEEPVITGVDMAKGEDTTVKTVVNPETKEVVSQEVVKPKEPKVEAPKVEEPKEEVIAEVEDITEASLNAMAYNDVKALAKKVGVKATGSKVNIIKNILATVDVKEETEETPNDEPVKDITPTEEADVQEDEVLDEEEGIPVEELEEEHQTFYDQVVADLEGYSDEELADILSDIGVSPKGKRQALLAKIVQAIEDGQLEWDEEDEESEEPVKEAETQPEATEEVEEVEYTKAKQTAMEEEADRLYALVDKGDLSHKEILKYLKEFFNGTYKSVGVEGDVDEYVAIQCDLIDDEGVKHDLADPYYVGDDVCCCGQKLKEVKDDYYCEICGTTYAR